MRDIGGTIFFSATDLMRFMGCAHATTLDLMRLRGEGPEPGEDSEDAALLQKQGDAHEAAHLERLKVSGRAVVEIPRGDLAADADATRDALAQGAEVLFQGAFLSGNWGGWSDFLMRVDRPSTLGPFSYEVADTKLKRRPHPKHVLQLVLYSDLLIEIQGVAPEFAYVELGSGERAMLRLTDYAHYARAARARLERFVADPQPTRPIPCADCGLCRWAGHCESVWQAEDSLFNVANINRGQVKKLEAAGTATMEALAGLDQPVRGMAEGTRLRLVTQARLQQARKSGGPTFELRAPEPGKGFDLLPEPQSGDLFYDIEGDPHFDGGLEYLHGIWHDGQFRAFWAHDHAAEARALEDLLTFFRARLEEYPQARIYHYAAYEITALRRLTAKYGIGEALLDRLLRERRFVNLFAVVRGGLIGSEQNYSIKSMEAFYDRKREGEVKTAGGSVVAYENWRETSDQHILNEIEDYNRIDCISTEELRDWLVSIRPPGPWPQPGQDAGPKETEEDAETQELRATLATAGLPEDRQAMLFNLGLFHRREAKPAQWAVFDSATKDEEDLIDDLDALAGLVTIGPVTPVKRSFARSYRFPPQETKLRGGKSATVPVVDGPPVSVSIEEIDRRTRQITVKAGPGKDHLLTDRLTLHPDWPVDTKVIATALRDVIADQCGPRAYRAVDDLLSRAVPRLTTGPLQPVADPVAGIIAAVGAMDGTVLPIQGPPGTGKTYVTARAILSLVKKGARVGVTSNSHEAIRNVLMGCLSALEDEDLPITLDLVHKTSAEEDSYPDNCLVRRTNSNGDAAAGRHVVGATAWFFARDENVQAFDCLFVDEAGQVGLANMAAMGRAARNIVLVGDPRQLPQVIQGAHPEPANLSCLDWMLGDHATVPSDRGIFLPVSRRMHPDVCRFVSDQVYEGRLESHPDTALQAVRGTSFPAAGAFWVPVPHEGNAQIASEEVAAISAATTDLLKGTWTGKDGTTRPMRASDIIVVAPYNTQVNALRDALPEAIRVGTVDKFQGQEAPVCLVSMTASSADETARGTEFLFSLNRINVAVSRAKGLTLVFGAPRLREAKCDTVEQMRLVNTLCALQMIPFGEGSA
ncbi:RecB family nuclease, putative, TM0106 family [Rhizobium leguminosarum bv. trifolii WSM2297]|uniref:RecB family nuclease, putative, TM0106 family n=1 Tax=Rhizobium leguminosarum bv. trifolii WSM2297 TaxID=754762 RepID=J0WIG6_RHILT|nr:TM0106 family RecB-like putative nuclease [Rhizobium leguminosarum]EJC85300.1 RecB family nuclease, putative, TM0106 family [Rhizobium leguminosarum bv. trifolii WSM2297]EJC85816.1 RecB family nuclease, putative, TM0106 family [Rhizobium leguminosarum bv. trifolii WSM2297]